MGMPRQTELQDTLTVDPHRPRYHFLPPPDWMNDPNGALFWKGRYHLFYQYNPISKGASWHATHWGHAVSVDLVYWRHLPIALSPTPGGPDEGGCWSGGAVVNNGVPTVIYFGNPPEGSSYGGNCIATSDDDVLIKWDKYPGNPVIPIPPEGQAEWRPYDPCAWKEGELFYSLSGGRIQGIGDTAYLFQSKDMVHWEYMHTLYIGGTWTDKDEDCAVPDFFPIDDKHMLLFASHKRGVQYYIGTYDSRKHNFQPEHHGRMNFSIGAMHSCVGSLKAGITLGDDKGRRIFFGWVDEGRSEAVQRASGWAGILSLPRVLSLSGDGTLRIEPVPELEILRGRHCRLTGLSIESNRFKLLKDIQGDCLEIAAEFDPGDATEFGLRVRCAPDGTEETLVFYDPERKYLTIDLERSSLSPDCRPICRLERGLLKLAEGETLSLRIFLDRSIVEVFANGRQCLTRRMYPSQSSSLGVGVFARGGRANLKSMDIWEMRSIWDRLPDLAVNTEGRNS